jgi:hypothetical protein
MVELYLHTPIRFHGMALNLLNTGTSLPFNLLRKKIQVVQKRWCEQVINYIAIKRKVSKMKQSNSKGKIHCPTIQRSVKAF